MNIEIELPDFGADAGDHATVSEWHFEEGDLVLENEVVLEIMGEHESHDITSPATGVLVERCVDEEDIVHVGDILAIVEVADGQEEDEAEERDIDFEE